MKSGNLNFLEPSGPLQACNGTALPCLKVMMMMMMMMIMMTMMMMIIIIIIIIRQPNYSATRKTNIFGC